MLNNRLKKALNTYGEFPAEFSNNPLFISGCMRSGTTFLVDKLSGHPQLLKIGSELNDAWEVLTKATMTNECNFLDNNDISNSDLYQITSYYNNSIWKERKAIRHLMRLKIKLERKMGRVLYDWDNIIPMNKSTHFNNKIGYISNLFPDSKFIYLIRNIYGQSASLKVHFDNNYRNYNEIAISPKEENKCWSFSRDKNKNNLNNFYPPTFEVIPKMWLRLNLLALEKLQDLDPTRYLIVSYENMIENQYDTFKEIFHFLDLKSDYLNSEENISKTTISYKNTSTKGNPIKKWEKILDENEKKFIENFINKNKSDYNKVINALKKDS